MTIDDLPADKDKDFDTKSDDKREKSNKSEPDNSVRNESNKSPEDEELLAMARQKILEYFVDQYSNPYIAVNIQGHLEVLPLNSTRVRHWLFRIYYIATNSIANSENVTNVINILKAEAIFGQVTKELYLRIASSNDLRWYYDLTNYKWECIEISVDGWKVTNDIALFKRYNNQIAQVYPVRNYPSDILEKFMDSLNINNSKVRLLLKCYAISLFVPNIPKPVFILYGEQGSAKTTVQELIKMLVDPSRMKTLAFPRDLKELVQKLDHNYVAYFDNLSYIQEWISDELCRAVTGSGFSTRELYTNDDDIIRNFMRCIGLNGINLGATKADLLDRSLIIQLERIPKEKRRKIGEIWGRFQEIKPQLLGYILDILVKVLQFKKQGNNIQLKTLPRMADFTEYCEIISRCMGYKQNEFLDAYYENIGLQVEEAIEANSVAVAIRNFMSNMNEWKGTATQLLTELNGLAETMKIEIKSKSWPKAPNQLSRRLNEARTNLREIGILIEWSTDSSNTKIITIRKVSPASPVSPEDPDQAQLFTENCGDISGDTNPGRKVSPKDNDQNYAQNSESGDIGDKNDTLHTSRSSVANQQDKINQNIYRLGHSDTWACQLCDWKGDKWLMQKHLCKGIK